MVSNFQVKWAPSILAADFARLGEQVEEVTRAGANYIHVDVMDGHFVPNITMGPVVVEAIRSHTNLPLDVHLMIAEPERYIGDFARAGAGNIIVHVEACAHLHRIVHQIKEAGLKAGVGLNPSTPLVAVEEVLPYVDVVLLATVNPGFAGQKLIPEALDKLARLKSLVAEGGYEVELQVDGGINAQTAPMAVRAGARILVAGTAVFNNKETVEAAMRRLMQSVENVYPK